MRDSANYHDIPRKEFLNSFAKLFGSKALDMVDEIHNAEGKFYLIGTINVAGIQSYYFSEEYSERLKYIDWEEAGFKGDMAVEIDIMRNNLMSAYLGLEPEAEEENKIIGRRGLDAVVKSLDRISRTVGEEADG